GGWSAPGAPGVKTTSTLSICPRLVTPGIPNASSRSSWTSDSSIVWAGRRAAGEAAAGAAAAPGAAAGPEAGGHEPSPQSLGATEEGALGAALGLLGSGGGARREGLGGSSPRTLSGSPATSLASASAASRALANRRIGSRLHARANHASKLAGTLAYAFDGTG